MARQVLQQVLVCVCVIDPENCGQTGAAAGVGVCVFVLYL